MSKKRAAILVVLGLALSPGLLAQGLEPGSYLSPLVQLQRLQGISDHLHVDEVRLRDDGLLLQCSYTFGVVDARDAARMRYLSQNLRHQIPGDERRPGCIHLAIDGDLVFTTHRGNLRNPAFLSGWDIRDPRRPVQLPVLQEAGTSYEGVDVAKGHLFVGLHEEGLGVYRYDAKGDLTRVGGVTGFENAWGVLARGDRVYVADGPGGLVTVDVTDPVHPRLVGRVATGGRATGIAVAGDVAYVASGSAGLVVVDVSDIEEPKVLAKVAMPGSAIRVDVSERHAFVAAWRDARVYDISSPEAPRFVGAVRLTRKLGLEDADRPEATSRVLGIAARGNDVFVGNWHVLYSYRLYPDRLAPRIRIPETATNLDFGPVEAGEERELSFEVANEGTAPLTLLNNWVSGPEFVVEPKQMRLEPAGTGRLVIRFRPESSEEGKGYLQILSDDPQSPIRSAYLVGNRPGLGVGMPLPETKAHLLDGTDWSSTETRGTVVLLAFFATF